MAPTDPFAAHNAEQAEVWRAFHEGRPVRVPMILGISSRYTIFNPEANPEGYDFEDFFCKPEAMFRHLLRREWHVRHRLWFDQEMGLPEKWTVGVDFQNSYEALWFGCPIHFREGQVPDTTPILNDGNKRMLFDRGIPEPFPESGWMARAWEYHEQFQEWAKTEEFCGRPIEVAGSVPGVGTDGVFTLACALRRPSDLMVDLYEDPGYVHELLGFLTEAIILRIRAYRRRLGIDEHSRAWSFADDAIQMLSPRHYREFVLPHHKKLVEAFGPDGPNSIHLCGDATRHFVTIRDELNVMSFDTGFPVDFGRLRRDLGPNVLIHGGPHVEALRVGPAERIVEETRRILRSGVTEGGKFVLREGNNLAPGTPPEHVRAMYEACKRYGGYGRCAPA